jgi:hypothetical protein
VGGYTTLALLSPELIVLLIGTMNTEHRRRRSSRKRRRKRIRKTT